MANRIPFYEAPANPRIPLAKKVSVHLIEVVNFLRFVVERDDLQVASYLGQMTQDPFFLVAATGLGKTVAVPVHELIRQAQHTGNLSVSEPRVWVVEPRIPIATSQASFMNGLWKDYLSAKRRKLPPLFGVITSSSGNVNRDAPIKFVTTGIFGQLAKNGELHPDRDRVLIDEAHVTIEQNSEVELGIALARKAGVTVDYMSATVDTSNLEEALGVTNVIRADKARYPIWKHNLLLPLSDVLADLLRSTLVNPDPASSYYPQWEFAQHADVQKAVLEAGRAHGMLIVVNSFAGDQSDTERLAALIRRHHPSLAVLQLASEVIRDTRRERAFYAQLQEIEQRKRNYVILATSVVEMGVTFSSLDYVVTMDSGYDQETVGDVTFPVIAPLGVNSLLQRMGRVGRRRPGIAYISREVGADYADLEDNELNRGGLKYEPIRFPLVNSTLMPLAYYLCKVGCVDIRRAVADLALPSRLHENEDRMEYLQEQFDELEQLGLATNGSLTPIGERMEQWIGQADLAYAVQLQRRLDEDASLPEVLFWTVATALSTTSLVTLRARYDYFVDYGNVHSELPHAVELFQGFPHEDLAAFNAICWLGEIAPWLLWPTSGESRPVEEEDIFELTKFCNVNGLDARKVRQAAKAIANTWKLLGRIDKGANQLGKLFVGEAPQELAHLSWRAIRAQIPQARIVEELADLPGQSAIELSYNDALGAFDWRDIRHGHEGLVSQDDTPIQLVDGARLQARVTPSRESKGGDTTWRFAHIGIRHGRNTPVQPKAPQAPVWAAHESTQDPFLEDFHANASTSTDRSWSARLKRWLSGN
ncbi:Helicase conserved C-terminal domain-containing protein [Lentzea aerocolonigenes]|nr:Helicase conserved C-terminal domain-containing protein [Lentzea aerocolonigenes]